MGVTKASVPGLNPALPSPVDATKFLDGTGAWSGPGPSTVSVQVFTADGNWAKPSGARLVSGVLYGAGGGGGGGRTGAPASVRAGGGGGGSGARIEFIIPADVLRAVEPVTVGAAGPGGTADADGTAGGDTWLWATDVLLAGGGGGGAKG